LPRRRSKALLACASLALVLGGACGRRDAQVGLVPLVDGAAGPALFSSQLERDDGFWKVSAPLPGSGVTFGAAAPGTRDGRVAELRFPGDPALSATDRVDPDLATQIETRQFFRYGTFKARVQFPACAAGEELASAVFMYFRDGRDVDDNGLTDLHELDLHVLCGAPSFIVLTAWSDYDAQPDGGAETFLMLSHAVDTATGDVYDTPAPGERVYAKTGNEPALAQPGFPAAGTFYDVGIEWLPARVRFFIVLGGAEWTLWTVTDARYVPQVPLPMMFNVWHPSTHWVPQRTPADYPALDGVMRVDSAEWLAP
jgi:hypothetical protein